MRFVIRSLCPLARREACPQERPPFVAVGLRRSG